MAIDVVREESGEVIHNKAVVFLEVAGSFMQHHAWERRG